MRKNLLAAAASALAIVAVAGQAMADQIALGNNTPSGATAYSYVWEGGPILVTSAGFTGLNEAFGEGPLAGDIGTYTFGSASFTLGPKVGTDFPIAAGSQSLTVTMSDGDTATGTVTWTEVEGGSPPAIIGDWAITSSSGDSVWTSDFVPGTTDNSIDLTGMASAGTATVLFGVLDPPSPSSVNEPGTLSLIGSLLFIGWLTRRMRPDHGSVRLVSDVS
jgi:hypothetical protein